MKIQTIGAKVIKVKQKVIQSKHKGGYFFLSCDYDFETNNLLSKYSFMFVISSHSKRFGHDIRFV